MKLIFAIIFSIPYLVMLVKSDPVVTTPLGTIQGISITASNGKEAKAFLGVPYAEPPTGPNRFLPPTRKQPWNDVFMATTLPKTCFQFDMTVNSGDGNASTPWWVPKYEMSEDCLQLNIWVPENLQTKTAVMVWIHGGGFAIGSANIAKFDGAILATQEQIIMVSINYRLSVFGFLHLKDTDVKGNMGLLDQVQALKWIQQNIEPFGGDKDRVTLFGVSAGGISGALHLVSSEQKLFHAVIIQSGVPETINFLNSFTSPKNHTETDGMSPIFDKLNCSGTISNQAIIDCLREISPEILMAHIPFMDGSDSLQPNVDGQFLKKDYQTLCNEKRFKEVSVMLGDTAQDGSVFASSFNPTICAMTGDCHLSRSDFLTMVQRLIPNVGELVHNAIDFYYTDWHHPNDQVHNRDEAMKMYTDVGFTCPTMSLAKNLVDSGRNVYQYQFNHTPSVSEVGTKWLGAFHGADVDFTFGWPLDPTKGFTYEEVTLSKIVMRYFANFAKYINPNGEGGVPSNNSPLWSEYNLHDQDYIDLSTNSFNGKGLRARQCAFWDKAFPELLRIEETLKKSKDC